MMKQTAARNVPSEAKMQCIRCHKSMKFRELRIPLLKVHKIPNVFLSCMEIVNEKVCEFFCGKTLNCFIEHMKQVHDEKFKGGAEYVFDDLSGFKLLTNGDTVRSHTEVCSIAREERRKEKVKECKERYVRKHKVEKKNTHKTSDGAGSMPAKRVSTKVTTHVETEGVEAGGELVQNEITPVIIKIKKWKVNAESSFIRC
jgi:hypothetical protein